MYSEKPQLFIEWDIDLANKPLLGKMLKSSMHKVKDLVLKLLTQDTELSTGPNGLVVWRGPDLALVDCVVVQGGVDDLETEFSVGL